MRKKKPIDDRLVGTSKDCVCALTVDEMLCSGQEIDLSGFKKTHNKAESEEQKLLRKNNSKDTDNMP